MAAYVNKMLAECRQYPDETVKKIREAVSNGQMTHRDLDYTALFYETHGGYGAVQAWAKSEAPYRVLREAAGGVSTAVFQNLTTPFVETALESAYMVPEAPFSALIPSIPTKKRYEVRRGITNIGDEAAAVEEGKDYPEVGVSPDWIQTPEVKKKGFILSLTKESILFDETGQLIEQATKGAEWFRLHWEKLAIRCVTDQGETTEAKYKYVWQGTAYDTYVNSPWDNLSASTALTDGASIDTAVQLLMDITDPATGEPANLTAKHLVVPPGLYRAAINALGGVVTTSVGGYPTSGNPTRTEIPNPTTQIWGDLTVVKGGQLLKNALGNSTTWFIGDLQKAFAFMEAIPFSAKQQGEDSDRSFSADIVQRFKVSRMGTYATMNPRHVVKCTA